MARISNALRQARDHVSSGCRDQRDRDMATPIKETCPSTATTTFCSMTPTVMYSRSALRASPGGTAILSASPIRSCRSCPVPPRRGCSPRREPTACRLPRDTSECPNCRGSRCGRRTRFTVPARCQRCLVCVARKRITASAPHLARSARTRPAFSDPVILTPSVCCIR